MGTPFSLHVHHETCSAWAEGPSMAGAGAAAKYHHIAWCCCFQPVMLHTGLSWFFSEQQKSSYCKSLRSNCILLPPRTHVNECVCSTLEGLKNFSFFSLLPTRPPSCSKRSAFKAVHFNSVYTNQTPMGFYHNPGMSKAPAGAWHGCAGGAAEVLGCTAPLIRDFFFFFSGNAWGKSKHFNISLELSPSRCWARWPWPRKAIEQSVTLCAHGCRPWPRQHLLLEWVRLGHRYGAGPKAPSWKQMSLWYIEQEKMCRSLTALRQLDPCLRKNCTLQIWYSWHKSNFSTFCKIHF